MDSNGGAQVISALEVIYSVKSNNEQRLESQRFLDNVKLQEESPLWGYEIALNNSSNFIVKHFGLGLLTHALKTHWNNYDAQRRIALRKWIMELNYRVTNEDPRYIKEKLAFLWVEVAKRSWGEALKGGEPTDELLTESWVDMDNNLSELWNINQASREVTLIIFRILFEDVFLLDDMIVLKRMTIIQPLCVMIVCPMEVFASKYKFTEKWTLFRSSNDGWFKTWIDELNIALGENNQEYVVRLLETLKTCLNWPLSEVIIRNDVISTLLRCFLSDIPKAQSMALDSMHILLTRPYSNDDHYKSVINNVFNNMDTLEKVYDSLQFDAKNGIDEAKYPIIKKFVDMISCLYVCVFKVDDNENQVEKYLRLVLKATYNESLIVSGLTLDLWCSCLRNDNFLPYLEKYIIPDLLQYAADALIYYEQIPDHVSKIFAETDFQSKTEFQSFCSSYRKNIRDIIRLISCVKLDLSYEWLNVRLNSYFSSQYGQQVLSSTFLDLKSEPYLSALSQFMIIECFINGCIRWKIWYTNSEDYDAKLDDILNKLEMLSNQLIALNIREPLLLKKEIQNFALFLTMLKDNVLFTLLEKIITTATMDYPGIDEENNSEEYEAVRELRYACGIELNRMALLMPESLKSIYADLESVVSRILPKLSYHEKISFKSFLLTIVLKSSLDRKEERFAELVDSELVAWSDKSTEVGLSDLPWFMERLGIVKIAEYFQRRNIDENSDLLSIPIDEEGKQLKMELTKRWQTLFPVRATRMFIHYSMQSVKKDSEFKMLQDMWRPRIVPILPYILRLLYQLQSYHDPENWKELPNVVQSFVKYSTVERFWEAGASNKSKDEFIDEHMKAMHTLRDFADSVGHIVRYTREYTLLVVAAISSLGSVFFDIDEMPELLFNSIAIYKPDRNEISPGVSTHGWKHILNVAIRPILKNCPDECASKFMPVFLPKLFNTLDVILCEKWSKVMQGHETEPIPTDDEEMTEEILEENLLRQLTTVVVLILIDSVGQNGSSSKSKLNSHQIKMRKTIFEDINLLAPFLKLLNHLISFKDTKCSFNAVLLMKSCLADVLIKNESVDEFFTVEVMKTLLVNLTANNSNRDSFYEGMYVFTVLFLTLYKEYKSTRQYLYEISHGYDTEKLYENLRKVDNFKNQRALMVDYFDYIRRNNGTSNDNDDDVVADERKRQEKREANLLKATQKLVQKNKGPTDLLDDPSTENDAMGNLFGSA
ncbi:similar to Saccharomyces cerevisiae YDR335W MSN5 Karyopherin involved in nuclear import and export of proteins, including import of replication protein A and export of Swi6p, Far1p, and Pho4p [Maudiozyma barnettii]|uniref:Similar to Saccharomyces cerevisiae YDR335W MSN5 Karyopherin involved in nuclear import and export of proteins, including import of replication protein A and export of Swi6p, Far1p, and Pho4p n=1 Tax=Maudiozyma barnettii TaxID=61262 RepID=A0A8H2VAV1_9SACH|nr:karyopherin MSN5 [Kazachstania barnettii]CAB4251868.1 similar to Saccharomyces cerevisiae YDR335W MSN5 Karyopherin involved in nuclear import and export of proteins, including import of replication protein A and export of Swi6p, Far1p, and Pho4p [Kazachstania barnettii]CAD1778157.1 similar to Saccharomyces cerevisiae YDR335W MSN5 Karyopherin involved in nuclear import and export of proteins, including import of replication protein A and export of Swi6p, Far1p, and Pho4p [Kazachstania barnettii